MSNNAGINAVACLGAEGLIVCAGSDGTISFYNAEYNRVNYLNTGGSRVTYMTEATFMGKSLLFWSMDHFDPALGGEHVGVIQMIDVANLSTDPPRVTLMVFYLMYRNCFLWLLLCALSFSAERKRHAIYSSAVNFQVHRN